MNYRFKGFSVCFSLLLLLPLLPRESYALVEARDISGMDAVASREGFANCWQLFDGDRHQAITISPGSSVTLGHPEGIGSAYLIFDEEPGPYTVTNKDTGEVLACGTEGFLHDYLDLEGAFGAGAKTVTIAFPAGEIRLNELRIYTPGQVPDSVQKWKSPQEGKTDLMLFSTHGDDEQLFFAGLLPHYAGELGYEVLVAYLTDHRNCGTLRRHEMLDGLWAVGVRTYPLLGTLADHYCRSRDQAYALHRQDGQDHHALLGAVVEQLRRYRPLVAVGHDVNGEYGHGQHMLYADLLCQAVQAAADPAAFPESAEALGVWDTPKTYLHLWPENTITMDYDQPLRAFQGMTAFQVSRDLGFSCHKSQHWSFGWFLSGSQCAADIPKYSPCQFGLYRSTRGPDPEKRDMFAHLIPYENQRILSESISHNRIALLRMRSAASELLETKRQYREKTAQIRRSNQQKAARLEDTIIFSVTIFSLSLLSWQAFRRKNKKSRNL